MIQQILYHHEAAGHLTGAGQGRGTYPLHPPLIDPPLYHHLHFQRRGIEAVRFFLPLSFRMTSLYIFKSNEHLRIPFLNSTACA